MAADFEPGDLLMGMVDSVLVAQTVEKRPHRDYKARIPLSAASVVAEAAAKRNMSVSAYIRRATLSFVATDLGLDLADLLADEPATRLKSEGPQTNRLEQGRGHGLWIIRGLL